MQDLMNEIRKLIEYVGPEGTIKKEDIDALAIKKPEAVVFDLTDHLANKELNKALDTYRDLISQNVSDQMILIMIYRHFRNLYIFKLSNTADVATNLKLKPNQTFLPKIYARQAQYFTIEELKEILFELINIDESTKNGNLDSISLGLESIMCKYFGK
jgi:DNA polymerase-3 subunit delta